MGPLKHPLKHPLQTAEDQAIYAKERRRMQCRLAQSRYRRSPKGKAALARYNRSDTRRAANARYLATEGGRRANTTLNQRRVYVGAAYRGRAQTTEQADMIREFVKERLRAFTRQQARAEAEGAETRTVSPETES